MIKPLHDYILVRVRPEINQTSSGLFIPETTKDRPAEGEVINVGPGKLIKNKLCPVDIKIGDLVLFNKFAGDDVGDNCRLLREEEIIATLNT